MKNRIKILFLAVVISVISGCSKYLELDPLSSAYGEQIWGNAQGCRQMLSGTYSLFRRTLLAERPFYIYGDLPSQTVFKSNEGSYLGPISNGEYTAPYVVWGFKAWNPFYKIITTSNTLLKHINDVADEDFNKDVEAGKKEKKQIEAEANFLYAYTYFWLVRIYGDVPLVKEAIESVDQAMIDGATVGRRQSPEKEVLEYALQRLDAAIVNLDYRAATDKDWAVRADKGAALALKGHMCLWLANSYKDTPRYKELVQQAEECLATVIAEGNRSLVDYDDPVAVNKMFEGQSTEGVFELNVSVTQNETFWINYGTWHVHCRTYWREEFKSKYGIGEIVVPDATYSTSLYSDKDIRRNIFYANFANPNKDEKLPPVLLKYSTGLREDGSNPGRYYANSNVMLMRLTDIYLLRAEALYKLGRYGQARMILNDFRNRSKIGNFTEGDDQLLKGIFEERARELAGEGHSAFDRIRCDYWDDCSWMDADRKAKKGYYWPVLFEYLFSSNRDLYQNPYWQGKI